MACHRDSSHQILWHYIPEDKILHTHRCENLKSILVQWYVSEYKETL
jgi:hypothetical protein